MKHLAGVGEASPFPLRWKEEDLGQKLYQGQGESRFLLY